MISFNHLFIHEIELFEQMMIYDRVFEKCENFVVFSNESVIINIDCI